MKVIVFGATGAAGQGIVRACLDDPDVAEIVAPVRRSLAVESAKLREVEIPDFGDLAALREHAAGVDACFYALGVSQSQVPDEDRYRVIVHDYALAAARLLLEHSPGHALHFVSGQGTNPRSRMMWARIKGQTEVDLQGLGLAGLICYRPGYIHPERMREPPLTGERLTRILYPLLSWIPGMSIRARQIGEAMLQAQTEQLREGTLENRAMRELAARYMQRRAASSA